MQETNVAKRYIYYKKTCLLELMFYGLPVFIDNTASSELTRLRIFSI